MRDPYYLCVATYKGVQFPGRNTPLISKKLFEQVQVVMDGRASAVESCDEGRRMIDQAIYQQLYADDGVVTSELFAEPTVAVHLGHTDVDPGAPTITG